MPVAYNLLIHIDSSWAELFLLRLDLLFSEHLLFCPFWAFSLLAANLFYFLSFFAFPPSYHLIYFLNKEHPCAIAVQRLWTLLLAFHLDPGRDMFQINTGRDLVNMLSPFSSWTDKRFFDLFFPDIQGVHLFSKFFLFWEADRKSSHNKILTQ